jgi:tetratricopeptide (TPR) repeat protein
VDITGGQGINAGDGPQFNFFLGPSPGPVVAGNVPQVARAFQPRRNLMARLSRPTANAPSIRVLAGLRGAGKTQLAAAYARACINDGWRLVAWVNAESALAVGGGLAVVADRIGMGQSDRPLKAVGLAVRNFLEAGGERCLIVFDNVADIDAVRPYLPAAGRSQVVITSTDALGADPTALVPVGVFTAEEALAYVQERTGRKEPRGGAALAEELGYLPLAIAQATAVIYRQRISCAQYLERLRSRTVREAVTRADKDAYPFGVAEAILLAVDSVTADDPTGLCRDLLDLVSLLSPSGVPRAILRHGAAAGILVSAADDAVDDALGQLAEASLLTYSEDDSRVAVHRLIARVLRELAIDDGTAPEIGAKAVRLLHAYGESLADPRRQRHEARDFVRQVAAVTDHLARIGQDAEPHRLLALRGLALSCVNDLNESPAQAVQLGKQIVADAEQALDQGDPITASLRNNLGVAYREAGEPGKAVPLYEAVLAERAATLGPTHPDTLVTRSNLASAYHAQRRLPEAASMFEEVLRERERTLDATDRATMTARNNLALVYRDQGRLDDALLMFLALADDSEQALGASHANTLTTKNNAALALRDLGRLDEAMSLLEAVRSASERAMGASHPDTLIARLNLGRAYLDAHRPDAAVQVLEAVVPDCEQVLGGSHPYTLRSRCHLALAYRAVDRPAAAIALFEQVLPETEREFGADHRFTREVREALTRREDGGGTEPD